MFDVNLMTSIMERQPQTPSMPSPPSGSPSPMMPSPVSSTGSSSPIRSPALPPSPPASCDGRSPPPLVRIQPEVRLPLSPPPSAQSPRTLPFSIENILRPDFGALPPPKISIKVPERPFNNKTPDLVLRTPPKTPENSTTRHDFPVDLSQKSNHTALIIPNISSPTNSSSSQDLKSRHLPSPTLLSKNDSDLQNSPGCSRTRYPENPEELANPKVPESEMVWPAWVYCTRYSDRPSSGNLINSF